MPTTFHIRHKTTGEYYSEYKYGWGQNNQWQKGELKYTAKGYGKSFKEVAKIKMHLLYLVGIFMPPKEIQEKRHRRIKLHKYVQWIGGTRIEPEQTPEFLDLERELEIWDMMHPGYGNIPDWLYNPDPLDSVPKEWEIVEVVDKKNKIINIVDFDPHAYVEQAQQLRKLTDNHGSAVRDVYKKIDKAGKLQDFAYVVALQINPVHVTDWQNPSVNAEDMRAALDSMGLKRNETVRTTKNDSIAIAFKDEDTAAWFIMNYFGKDKIALLDILNLKEMVTPVRKEAANG